MNCAPSDLRDYFFDELSTAEARAMESHLAACAGCRMEFDRFNVTRVSMLELPQEEVPRRISFVSDKVFEPSWWQRFWQSGPKVGFASAAMIFAGFIVNALMVPAPVVRQQADVNYAVIDAKVKEEVARRLPAVVGQAVSEARQQDSARLAVAVAAVEKKYQGQRQEDMAAMQATLDVWQRKLSRMYLASYEVGPAAGTR